MTEEQQALVIAAHGSHRNEDSSKSAFGHANAIRDTTTIAEVKEAFWKEEPSFREVLRMLTSPTVIVVPLFMSEGYFFEEILPRELRLTGREPLDVDKDIRITPPVGTDPLIRIVIEHRAASIISKDMPLSQVALAVIGHGTERNKQSALSTLSHVKQLQESGRFGEVEAFFLDEGPYVEDVYTTFASSDIVVVPLFVADGYHTTSDIPRALGITPGSPSATTAPATVKERNVWYAGAVGTDPRMVDVILARAKAAGLEVDSPGSDGIA